MKTIYTEKPNELAIRNQNLPRLQQEEVLIKVIYAGICGSDIHAFEGTHPFRKPPVSMGHELSGVVVKIGSNVTRINLGAEVTVIPQIGCMTCEYCLQGNENLCETRQAPGVGNWMGAMSEYFIAPESIVVELPPTVDLKSGVLIEPLAVGFHALKKADIKKSDKIAVLGCGTIGLLTLSALQSKVSSDSLVTDVRNYPLTISEKIGADISLNVKDKPKWTKDAVDFVGGKFDKVFVTTDVPGIINDALQIVKNGGKIITVAMVNDEQKVNLSNLQGKEKELIGCMTYNKKDFEEALSYMETRGEDIQKQIITHIFPFTDAMEGFQILAENREESLKVLLKL